MKYTDDIKWAARFVLRRTRDVIYMAAGSAPPGPFRSSITLDKDDVELARRLLRERESWFADDGTVARYETEFAVWNGSRHAFAFMSGRESLSAIIHALGLQPGDEVILPGYTCVVVANAFLFAGIVPVYCDIELETYGLDVSLIEKKITLRTRAILLHHLYGLVCRDYDAIIAAARRNGLKVIEDCAQSTGAMYRGVRVGNLGDAAFYSSEQSKIYCTVQGGMAITADGDVAENIREYYLAAKTPDENWIERQLYTLIMNYYRSKHPWSYLLGDVYEKIYAEKRLISTTQQEENGEKPHYYGRKMPSPIAQIGLNQLKKVDKYNDKRRECAARWDRWCEEKGYGKPLVVKDSVPVFLRYPVMVAPEKKRDTRWALRDPGVNAGVWFVSHLHPSNRRVEGCPNADRAVEGCINFPGAL